MDLRPRPSEGRAVAAGTGLIWLAASRGRIGAWLRPGFLLASLIGWAAFAGLAVLASAATFLPGDLATARWIQSVSWAPISSTFGVISWLSGGPQDVLAVGTIVLVAILNRRVALFALFAMADAGLYLVVNTAIHKPRPVEGLVHVSEQAAAYAFPSGHATFVVTIVVVLLLCLGLRLFVDRRLFGLMVLVGAAVVLTVGVERIYVGAHYPSDVLGGFILAFSWLCFVIAVRPLSDHLIGIKALPATSPMTVQTNGTEATVREEVLVP